MYMLLLNCALKLVEEIILPLLFLYLQPSVVSTVRCFALHLRLALTKYFCFTYFCYRAFGILIIEDNDKAWFPSEDLREFHGIVPHQVTTAERTLFCIHEDGSEGLCCPTGDVDEDDT